MGLCILETPFAWTFCFSLGKSNTTQMLAHILFTLSVDYADWGNTTRTGRKWGWNKCSRAFWSIPAKGLHVPRNSYWWNCGYVCLTWNHALLCIQNQLFPQKFGKQFYKNTITKNSLLQCYGFIDKWQQTDKSQHKPFSEMTKPSSENGNSQTNLNKKQWHWKKKVFISNDNRQIIKKNCRKSIWVITLRKT